MSSATCSICGGEPSDVQCPARTNGYACTRRGTPVSFVKHDDGKLPLDLLPIVALEEMAKVLRFGAAKYSAHGWRTVDKRSRYLAATLRHLFAYARGGS